MLEISRLRDKINKGRPRTCLSSACVDIRIYSMSKQGKKQRNILERDTVSDYVLYIIYEQRHSLRRVLMQKGCRRSVRLPSGTPKKMCRQCTELLRPDCRTSCSANLTDCLSRTWRSR
ncbi:c8.1 [Ichnoviriform fugitivi]|uniref:C8.1 n=1 Tax=Ichnoviriform fugitivi TaxID=265522 RepID=A2Q0H2_9VIRU|nr:c8.1 [Ichnoviriform fugitivi]BAF45687.1 c8.1 [Ichnoviriform fugitivi]